MPILRPFASLLGVLLAVGAGMALRLPDETSLSPAEALGRESASPHRWADLGDALYVEGREDQARAAYQRALQLAPGIPQVWVRAANFHFQLGEAAIGLREGVTALRMADAYDDILFSYFDELIHDPRIVLAAIGGDDRTARSYTSHLIAGHNMEGAQIAWSHLKVKDQALKNAYIDALLSTHHYQAAQALGCASICNGGFETEPSGSSLDWRIQPSEQFDTIRDNTIAHEGKWSLKIKFHGTDNYTYGNISQTVIVSPGAHLLRAWVRADNITTNEGPRLAVLNTHTDPISGTHDWMAVDLPFVVPPSVSTVQVRVVRNPSQKFDNKIDGTMWIDSVILQD